MAAEYLAEGVNAPAVMLRRGRCKYIRCAGDPEQLYDLEADPRELRNLAPDAPDLCAELRARGRRPLGPAGAESAVLRSQEQRRLVVSALNTGRPASWNYVPRSDGEYVVGREDLYDLQRRARLDA